MTLDLDREKLKLLLLEETVAPSSKQYIWLSNHVSKKSYSSLLEEGLRHYPFNRKLTKKLNKHYKRTVFSTSQFKRLAKNILKANKKNSYVFYKECTNYLHKSGYIDEAVKVLQQGMRLNEQSKAYIKYVISFAKKTFNWPLAISAYERLLGFEEKASTLYDLAVCYEIIGKLELAAPLYEKVHEKYADDYEDLFEDYYRKYTLFNNGLSKIEYYKNIVPNNEVVATFDTITKTWEQTPFAYNAIKKRAKDIIALRRHSVRNFHQDLSREAYLQATQTIFSNKDQKYAYGTSLGGYCALYYGSLIPKAKILAMAPRNSAHPSYNKFNLNRNETFNHISPHPVQKEIDVVIMYDPKNTIDQNYLTSEIFPSYPTAKVMTIPYAGHRIPKFLTQSGQLKTVVTKFFTNKKILPIKRGDLRYKSSEYFWVIAEKCVEHCHYSWAINYANYSIQLDSNFERPYLTRIHASIQLEDFQAAIDYAKIAYDLFDAPAKFAHPLVDTLLLIGEKEQAMTLIEQHLQKKKDKYLSDCLLTLQNEEKIEVVL